jgi:hypothetical protein
MNDETSLIGFKAICNFVNELEAEYGKNHKPLRLYKRLVNHTQIAHDNAIKRHLSVFQNFCISNREAFSERDASKLSESKILYSERVFIDMSVIFRLSDSETASIIWKHLLTISAIVDPAGKARELLKKVTVEDKDSSAEADFLQGIISKVETSVKPESNPMEALSSIMQSGLFNDMMSDIGSKKLDMGKLLGVVQGMVSSFGEQAGTDPETKQAIGMMSNMMGGMLNNAGNGAPPDISGMMQMMMNSMPKNN